MATRDVPIVFLHSSGLSSRQWARWVDAVDGYRPILVDLSGVGPTALEDDLAAVGAILAAEGRAHLVGHSYGGVVALRAAADRPQHVGGIAVYEPPVLSVLGSASPTAGLPDDFLDPARMGTEPWLEAFVDSWNGAGAWASLADGVRASFVRSGARVAGEVLGLLADRTPAGTFTGLPILLLRSDRVPEPVNTALDVLGAVPGVRTVVVPGVGHMAPLTHPGRLVPAVLDHLRWAEVARFAGKR